MCDYIKDVMESMGWTDGSFLPIANEENQYILDEINRLSKEESEKELGLRNAEQRQSSLTEHYKNAENGINQNLKLLLAQRNQVTAENNMIQVGDREVSKLKQDIKALIKEIEELTNYGNKTDSEIDRLNCSIETLTDKVKWAKSALSEWQEAMSESEKTNNLIKKYCMEDETKARALDGRRRTLQDLINKEKTKLIDMYEDQKTAEKNLDRIADLYRQNHMHRRHLVNTWKDAVNQMNQRENDITFTEKELNNSNDELNEELGVLKQHESFLNQLIINNKEVEDETSVINRDASELRKQLSALNELITTKESELEIINKEAQIIISILDNSRSQVKKLMRDKNDKQTQLEKTEIDCINLKNKLEIFLNNQLSAQDRLHMIEEMVETEQKLEKQLAKEMQRINSLMYRTEQNLFNLKDEQKVLKNEVYSTQIAVNGLKAGIVDLEKDHKNAMEQDYNIGLNIQLTEMRLNKMLGGGISSSEQLKLQTRINKKEELSEKLKRQLSNIRTQIDKLDSDMQSITQNYNSEIKELEKINFKIKQAELYVEGGQRHTKQTTEKNQSLIVELSILKMRMCEIELHISKCNDKQYNLDKHLIELEKTMKERMIDINAQLELLKLKRRTLNDEYGTLKMDLGERQLKIDAAKKRYDISTELLGKNEDGTYMTGTQLKIETAQEKQLLLHEGNKLNDKVLKAENEIKAMENTLCLFNYSNCTYKKTFEKLDDQNSEIIELKKDEEEYCKYLQILKKCKTILKQRQHDLEEAIQKREIIEKELFEISRVRTDNSETLTKIHKDIIDQKVKLQRAERDINCSLRAVQQRSFDPDFLNAFEKDINFREFEERNTNCLQLIADFVDADYEMSSVFSKLLTEKGIKVPQMKCLKGNVPWRADYPSLSLTASSKGSVCGSISSRSTTSNSSSSVISIDFPGTGEGVRVLKSKLVEKPSSSVLSINFPLRQGIKVLKNKNQQKKKK